MALRRLEPFLSGSNPANDDDDDAVLTSMMKLLASEQTRADLLMNVVIPVGVALAYETDFDRLLERIVTDAMSLCQADAGALYLLGDDQMLRPTIVQVTSLKIAWGGKSATPASDAPVPRLHPTHGGPNANSIAARASYWGNPVNIADTLADPDFVSDESDAFFQKTGYQTRSCLAVPLRNADGVIIGVVELANAIDADGAICPFECSTQEIIESLCSLASAAVESYLRQQALRRQVQEMTIKIDEAKKQKQVSAIVASDYFKNLRSRAKALRQTVENDLSSTGQDENCAGNRPSR